MTLDYLEYILLKLPISSEHLKRDPQLSVKLDIEFVELSKLKKREIAHLLSSLRLPFHFEVISTIGKDVITTTRLYFHDYPTNKVKKSTDNKITTHLLLPVIEFELNKYATKQEIMEKLLDAHIFVNSEKMVIEANGTMLENTWKKLEILFDDTLLAAKVKTPTKELIVFGNLSSLINDIMTLLIINATTLQVRIYLYPITI